MGRCVISREDKEDFAKKVTSVKEQAYRIAYCYLYDEQDSIDAVCEAVEKAFRNIKKIKDPDLFKTWFIRIVINECKMLLRKRRKTLFIIDKFYEQHYFIDIDEKIDLDTILKRMNTNDRALLFMKYYLGYTFEEIADIAHLPVGTVKTRIYGNMKVLRKALCYEEA